MIRLTFVARADKTTVTMNKKASFVVVVVVDLAFLA